MPRTVIKTKTAPSPVGPYNQAIVVGDTIYVSGQGPIDPAIGKLNKGTFEEQATLTLQNIKAILEAAGSSLRDAVKVTVYLANLEDFDKLNEIYRRFFSEPYPARATAGAQLLFDSLIEVDCIAVRGSGA
ncbi:MAG: deaminase [Acidobacteria bacterium]|nr:MAG: deaminase [Acidobacteriota bacterium]